MDGWLAGWRENVCIAELYLCRRMGGWCVDGWMCIGWVAG